MCENFLNENDNNNNANSIISVTGPSPTYWSILNIINSKFIDCNAGGALIEAKNDVSLKIQDCYIYNNNWDAIVDSTANGILSVSNNDGFATFSSSTINVIADNLTTDNNLGVLSGGVYGLNLIDS